jgi:hypothetical protein
VKHGRDAASERARSGTDETERETAGDPKARKSPTQPQVDPESPGATIDSPTPAEPNEPG